jgi:hypothetical protein
MIRLFDGVTLNTLPILCKPCSSERHEDQRNSIKFLFLCLCDGEV